MCEAVSCSTYIILDWVFHSSWSVFVFNACKPSYSIHDIFDYVSVIKMIPHHIWLRYHLPTDAQVLNTIFGSASIIMSSLRNRWLTPREALVVQGLPVDTYYAYGVPCSSFALRTQLEKHDRQFSPWPSRRSMFEQSGNSMHTSVSGLVFMFILTQVIMGQQWCSFTMTHWWDVPL